MNKSAVIELNVTNFNQEVLCAGRPVLVQFWAGWSKQCNEMALWLDSVADRVTVPVKVARVNVEEQESLSEAHGVRAVPTLLIFYSGELREQIVGNTTEWEVRDRLECLK